MSRVNYDKSVLWKYQLFYDSDSQAQLCQFQLCKYQLCARQIQLPSKWRSSKKGVARGAELQNKLEHTWNQAVRAALSMMRVLLPRRRSARRTARRIASHRGVGELYLSRPRIRETSESVSCFFFRGRQKMYIHTELRAWSWATESQPQSVLSLESSANYRAQRSYIGIVWFYKETA